MDNDSLNKWPNWIRWAIAYPAALIGSLLIAGLNKDSAGDFSTRYGYMVA